MSIHGAHGDMFCRIGSRLDRLNTLLFKLTLWGCSRFCSDQAGDGPKSCERMREILERKRSRQLERELVLQARRLLSSQRGNGLHHPGSLQGKIYRRISRGSAPWEPSESSARHEARWRLSLKSTVLLMSVRSHELSGLRFVIVVKLL